LWRNHEETKLCAREQVDVAMRRCPGLLR